MQIAKTRLQDAVTRFKQGFADQPTRALDELLSSDMLGAMVDEEVGAFRERVYPSLTTLGLFIGQALSPDGGGVPRCGGPTSCRAYGAGRLAMQYQQRPLLQGSAAVAPVAD